MLSLSPSSVSLTGWIEAELSSGWDDMGRNASRFSFVEGIKPAVDLVSKSDSFKFPF